MKLLTRGGVETTLAGRIALTIQRIDIVTTDDSTLQSSPTRQQDSSPRVRVRDARRRGTPAWLWPEIAPAQWRAALSALEGCAAALLDGRRPGALRAPKPEAEQALCLAAYTSGLGPWLGWHVERGALDADAGAARQLTLHLAHGRARWERLDSALMDTAAVLHGAHIPATVFKGAHIARVYFAEPGLRPMSDLDVFVPGRDMDRAERALATAGFEENPRSRLRRPRRSEWRPAGAPKELQSLMLVHRDDPFAVDLHGTLDIDFFGVRTVAIGQPLPGHLERADWLAGNMSVLRQPLLAAQHAVHASHGLHGLTLIRLVELTLLLRRDMRAAGDWSSLSDLLRELGARRFAWPALALTEKLAPGTVQPRLLEQCADAAPARLRRIVTHMTPAAAQRIDSHALEERFMWADGPVEHLRRFGDMLVPGSAGGSVSRLGGIYVNRAYQLLRRRISWGPAEDYDSD